MALPDAADLVDACDIVDAVDGADDDLQTSDATSAICLVEMAASGVCEFFRDCEEMFSGESKDMFCGWVFCLIRLTRWLVC